MGLWDKLKGHKTDEDDAVALGVATGTTPSVWYDGDGGDEDDAGNDEEASAGDSGAGAGDGDGWSGGSGAGSDGGSGGGGDSGGAAMVEAAAAEGEPGSRPGWRLQPRS